MGMRAFARETSGAAALELALWAGLLVVPILNVMDVGLYVFQRMQVENAAQMAVQAGWKACDDATKQRPVTTKCAPNGGTLETYMRSIAQGSSSLTTRVTMTAPTVRYYCLNTSNVLVVMATAPTAPPANCSTAPGSASATPGEYLEVAVSYAYSPMFGAISVAGTFTTPISYTARTRVD